MTTWIDNAIENKYIQLYKYEDFKHTTNGERGGEGRFGQVACAEWPRTNRRVAMKKLKNYNLDKFVSEIKMHTTGHSSKNIVRFLGLTKDVDNELEQSYMMVFEYADQNSLRTFLQNNNIEWDVKLKLSIDIAKGLSYLHSLDIVHSDLQSNNIVVNKVHNCKEPEFIARITDFGSAMFVSDPGNNDNGVLGQIAFTDPQYLNDCRNYKKDLHSDIYSLGVVLWEISSNTTPFANYMPNLRGDFRQLCLTMEIIGGHRESRVLLTPEEFVDLYKSCWEWEPNRRPEIGEVIRILEKTNPILSNSLEVTMTIGEN